MVKAQERESRETSFQLFITEKESERGRERARVCERERERARERARESKELQLSVEVRMWMETMRGGSVAMLTATTCPAVAQSREAVSEKSNDRALQIRAGGQARGYPHTPRARFSRLAPPSPRSHCSAYSLSLSLTLPYLGDVSTATCNNYKC